MLRTTISTTTIPSTMHAQDRMPIQFIRWEASVLLTTELSGLFSGTLPTLGSEIALDAAELEENSPELISEEGTDEEDDALARVFAGFLELDGAELGGGADEVCALPVLEEETSSGGEDPSGGMELSSFHDVTPLSAARVFSVHQQAKKDSRIRTDSTFSRRFIKSPPPQFQFISVEVQKYYSIIGGYCKTRQNFCR